MAENASRILLVGHGLLDGPDSSATAQALSDWAEGGRVALWPLPAPAFLQRMSTTSGLLGPTQVAERLAELDDLEALFEQVAAQRRTGREVLGLAAPAWLTSSRSGRAWLDRVRAIAAGIAQLSLTVWPLAPGDRIVIDPRRYGPRPDVAEAQATSPSSSRLRVELQNLRSDPCSERRSSERAVGDFGRSSTTEGTSWRTCADSALHWRRPWRSPPLPRRRPRKPSP